MSNIIERMNAIASMYLTSVYVNAGSAYLKRRAYKGAPSQITDAKKKRKRKEQRIARRRNRNK